MTAYRFISALLFLGLVGAFSPTSGNASSIGPSLGEKKNFWVWDLSGMPPQFRYAESTLRAEGLRSLVYVDDRAWTDGVFGTFVDSLRYRLEIKAPDGALLPGLGVVPLVERVFAPLPKKVSPDDRVTVLVTDLGPTVDGFFSHFDQLQREDAERKGQRSNETNIIYINSRLADSNRAAAVVARETQQLASYYRGTSVPQDLWLSETLGESAMLVAGYPSDQKLADSFAQNSEQHPLVSSSDVQVGPQLLFASYLLDTLHNPESGLSFLSGTNLIGRDAVEALFRRETANPLTFDAIFSDFVGYVFENESQPIPRTMAHDSRPSLRVPHIQPYIVVNSYPVDVKGSMLPYTFLTVALPEALPPNSIIQVESLKEGGPGSCSRQASVLWKPLNPKLIAIYAVGCAHRSMADAVQFRLRVLEKPFLPSKKPGKIAP